VFFNDGVGTINGTFDFRIQNLMTLSSVSAKLILSLVEEEANRGASFLSGLVIPVGFGKMGSKFPGSSFPIFKRPF